MTAGVRTGEPAARPLLLEARDVHKSYRRGPEEVHALQGAGFDLRSGEVVALVGPSGSGKTTLLNVLCGWEHPDRGEVAWAADGEARPEGRPWRELAIVPQALGLMEELSIQENVGLPLRLAGRLDEEGERWVNRLLSGFGLEQYAERQPAELSLGEQQRTAVARAMILLPKLLLADEPTGHQDAEWASAVFRAFRWVAGRGASCLVATHSREFLNHVDRVLAIRDGRVASETAEAASVT